MLKTKNEELNELGNADQTRITTHWKTVKSQTSFKFEIYFQQSLQLMFLQVKEIYRFNFGFGFSQL